MQRVSSSRSNRSLKLTLCARYMKLGLQGITMLFASGDNGVAGGNGQCCASPQCAGGVYNDGNSGTFNPSFPSTCPYVTSVGVSRSTLPAPFSQARNSLHPQNRQLKLNQGLPSLPQKKPQTSQSSNSGLGEDSATFSKHHHTKPQL
jgi:subtilase family serine protease